MNRQKIVIQDAVEAYRDQVLDALDSMAELFKRSAELHRELEARDRGHWATRRLVAGWLERMISDPRTTIENQAGPWDHATVTACIHALREGRDPATAGREKDKEAT